MAFTELPTREDQGRLPWAIEGSSAISGHHDFGNQTYVGHIEVVEHHPLVFFVDVVVVFPRIFPGADQGTFARLVELLQIVESGRLALLLEDSNRFLRLIFG